MKVDDIGQLKIPDATAQQKRILGREWPPRRGGWPTRLAQWVYHRTKAEGSQHRSLLPIAVVSMYRQKKNSTTASRTTSLTSMATATTFSQASHIPRHDVFYFVAMCCFHTALKHSFVRRQHCYVVLYEYPFILSACLSFRSGIQRLVPCWSISISACVICNLSVGASTVSRCISL